MSDALHTPQNDLAFMRQLVEGDHRAPEGFGAIYTMTGAVYLGQVVLGLLQINGLITLSDRATGLANMFFTVLFLVLLVPIIRIYARRGVGGGGVTARAFNAGFMAVGCAALTLAAALAAAAWRLHNPLVLQLIPAAAFALQGAAWLLAWTLRRRAWFAVVAIGWFIAAVGVAAALGNMPLYVAIIGAALLFLMVTPGIAIVRSARAA